MQIYHFSFSTAQEAIIRGVRKPSGDTTLLIAETDYTRAKIKAETNIKNRAYYTGNLEDYDLTFEWIERDCQVEAIKSQKKHKWL